MKTIGKKILTGTIAAGFLLGGGLTAALTQAQAQDNAPTADKSGSKQDKQTFSKKTLEFRGAHGGSALQNAAAVIGVEQNVIIEELKQGKTLAQIAQEKAGLSEEDFVQKLTAAATKAIDEAVASGKLTQEQADKQKANLADRLKKEVTGKNFVMREKGDKEDKFHGGKGDIRGFNVFQQAATILGAEQKAILDELKQGKTLAQIAQEKAGLSKEAFVQKLIAAETASIDQAVTDGKLTQDEAAKRKEGLADRLNKLVDNNGMKFDRIDGFGKKPPIGAMGNPDTLASIIGITKEQLTAELQAGKSLVEIAQANGVTEDQLISKLKDSMTDTIKQFAERKGGFHMKVKGAPAADAKTAE